MVGDDQMRIIERLAILSTVDEKWMDHLDEVESLREGIWLRGDKRTVLSEYKKEAFGLFEGLIDSIDATIARRIFRIHPAQQPVEQPQPTSRPVSSSVSLMAACKKSSSGSSLPPMPFNLPLST